LTSPNVTDGGAGVRPLDRGLARFRAMRRQIEASVLPLATSVDGRRFSFQASLHGLRHRLGGYVVLEDDDGTKRLGQILAIDFAMRSGAEIGLEPGEDAPVAVRTDLTIRYAEGHGVILEGDGASFHDAEMRPATVERLRAWVGRATRHAALEIGRLALVPDLPCRIDAGGFDRHTFLCGQSGSGKTYSLGVILERLLLETRLRIVILDPNSDFVRLRSVRAGTDATTAEQYRRVARDVTVHSSRPGSDERLRLRMAELDPAAQAALLRLDPVADREEHAELAELLSSGVVPTAPGDRPEAQRLALRARSLGLEGLGVWARTEPGSVLDHLQDPARRGVVVDLGSLPRREEQALVASAVLGEPWRRREERNPVLIVIDEAHNVCPARPQDGLTALATEHAVRIAAEGRKFGLYLLVSTQRPQKVHENVVSQCDNLVLMRLNSAADGAFAQGVFSFVPPSLIEQAATFRLGEALIAGKIAPQPVLARFGTRVAEEGGSDVPATWALAQPESAHAP
jgi:DNA helicase HerA-like ATPase